MLDDRAVLRLSGPDVRAFLQGLVTQDVEGTLPRWSGLLSPQGKALFDFLLWEDDEDILIDCEAAAAEALIRRLSMYRLRRAITIERDPDLAVHWSPTRPASDPCGSLDPHPDPRLATLGFRWLAAPATPAHGWLEHRLRLGVAEGQAELGDGTTLWLECNAEELNGVSYSKGCYIGQENTARMHYRAKVARRLFVAPIEPDDRARVRYPELGLMVTHRRIDTLGNVLLPAWLPDQTAPGDESQSHT
ncbi:YgfZ/GcvT domain-containing protein [Sphingomonas gellani]|nr:folate-binding protein YgfZ [Sphingomonas gellani]